MVPSARSEKWRTTASWRGEAELGEHHPAQPGERLCGAHGVLCKGAGSYHGPEGAASLTPDPRHVRFAP
jgi:hypothetical protein